MRMQTCCLSRSRCVNDLSLLRQSSLTLIGLHPPVTHTTLAWPLDPPLHHAGATGLSLMRTSLIRFAKRSATFSLALLAFDLLLYAVMVAGTILSGDLWLKLLFAIGAGTMIALTAIVGHDAGHQSFSNSRLLNRIAGTLAFLPALHPFSLWKHHHNRVHHVFTAQLGIDNAFPPMTVAQYRQASPWVRRRYRFIRSLWGQPFFYLLDVWLPDMAFPFLKGSTRLSRETWFDVLIVYAWFVAFLVATTMATMQVWGLSPINAFLSAFLFSWAIPFLVWNAFISFLSVVQHTAPDLKWSQPTGQPSTVEQSLAGTVHMEFPEWIDQLMHRIMQHPAHHLNVGIPLQQLKAAEAHLQSMAPVTRTARWSVGYHLELTRQCQLYDPVAHRWVTFAEADRAIPEMARAA